MKLKGKRNEVEKTPEQLSSEGFPFKKNEKFEQLSLDTEQTSQDSAENPVENSEPLPASQKEQVEEYIPQNEQEQLEEAEEKVKKLGTKKKKWLNILFLFINIGVVVGILAYQFSSEDVDISSIGTLFCNINWGIFFLLIVLYALLMFSESSRFWNLIYSTTKTHHPALSYKTAALGKYYDSLTPLSAGGEPFQIYYMSKRGLSGRNALSPGMAGPGDYLGAGFAAGGQRGHDLRGAGGSGRTAHERPEGQPVHLHGAAAGVRMPCIAQQDALSAAVRHGALPGVAEQRAGAVSGRDGISAGHAGNQSGDGQRGAGALLRDAGPLRTG